MNPNEAQQIAMAVSCVRPDWPQHSLASVLRGLPAKYRDRPARDVHLALVHLAHDPETRTPGRLAQDGPWWGTGRLAGVPDQPAVDERLLPRCPDHGVRLRPDGLCRECEAARKAIPQELDTVPPRQAGETRDQWVARIRRENRS